MAAVDEHPYVDLEPAFVTLGEGKEGATAEEPHFVLPDFLRSPDGEAAVANSPATEAPEKVELPQGSGAKSERLPEPIGPLATTPSPLAQGLSIPETVSSPSKDLSDLSPQRTILHTDSGDYLSDTSPQTPLAAPRKVLRLGDIMPEPPSLGSPERPTEGSSNHHLGTCKPCAFHFKSPQGGCQSGIDCKFCHLCEPGEKQRRRKGRQLVQKAAVEWQRQQAPQCGQGIILPGLGPWSPPYPVPPGVLLGWGATR